MRATEFVGHHSLQGQHESHVVTLQLDTLDWFRFQTFSGGHPDVTIRNVQQDGPDRLAIQCGCSTPEIRDQLRDDWNWCETRSCS
jgi:hypothetical protein